MIARPLNCLALEDFTIAINGKKQLKQIELNQPHNLHLLKEEFKDSPPLLSHVLIECLSLTLVTHQEISA